jgi:ATP-dependent Lon protease
LRELPDHVRAEMEFKFVDRVEQVLETMIPGLKLSSLALAS